MIVRCGTALVCLLIAAVCAGSARASELIDRNATAVKLEADRNGQALLTYRAGGKLKHVLVWGAVNALPPKRGGRQVAFKIDYSGGFGTVKRDVFKTFENGCTAYDGPALLWRVAACKAPDGSYWAVQSWQRMLPNYGLTPSPAQSAWELRLSHWTGDLPVLTVNVDWAYRKFDHLYGSLTYAGQPVFGFAATKGGIPLDTWGRNVYVDTFNSAYGKGWRRENSFLTHAPTGTFCYGFYAHGSRPLGTGTRYRATVIGPGVTPDAYWESASPGPFDPAADKADLEQQKAFLEGDNTCKPL